MKMFKVDFDEWFNPTTSFEEQEDSSVSYSEAYSFFTEHSFLFIISQEKIKRTAKHYAQQSAIGI